MMILDIAIKRLERVKLEKRVRVLFFAYGAGSE